MASERYDGAESLIQCGYISVGEFVRQLVKSPFYRDCFLSDTNPYYFIKLNHKHPLGRAPQRKPKFFTISAFSSKRAVTPKLTLIRIVLNTRVASGKKSFHTTMAGIIWLASRVINIPTCCS